MERQERYRHYEKILWDYNIKPVDVEAVLTRRQELAGHFNYRTLLIRLLESLPWFTVIELISPKNILLNLDDEVIASLRSKSLRKNYAFVKKRLSQIEDDFILGKDNFLGINKIPIEKAIPKLY